MDRRGDWYEGRNQEEPKGRRAGARPARSIGARLIEGLTELRDALASGEPLERCLKVRTVRLPQPPKAYAASRSFGPG